MTLGGTGSVSLSSLLCSFVCVPSVERQLRGTPSSRRVGGARCVLSYNFPRILVPPLLTIVPHIAFDTCHTYVREFMNDMKT